MLEFLAVAVFVYAYRLLTRCAFRGTCPSQYLLVEKLLCLQFSWVGEEGHCWIGHFRYIKRKACWPKARARLDHKKGGGSSSSRFTSITEVKKYTFYLSISSPYSITLDVFPTKILFPPGFLLGSMTIIVLSKSRADPLINSCQDLWREFFLGGFQGSWSAT